MFFNFFIYLFFLKVYFNNEVKLKIENIKIKAINFNFISTFIFCLFNFIRKMTYLYAFNVKINKQSYNKILYEFCKLYENIIVAITYEVKKKDIHYYC